MDKKVKKKQYEVMKTGDFTDWLNGLRDRRAKAKIIVRIERMEDGNLANSAPV